MKKLLIILFSILISFNSYGGWFDEKPNLGISCDNFAKFAKGNKLNNMFGGTSKILKVSKPTEICRSKSKLVCVGDLKVSTGFKNMKMRMEVYRDDDGDVYWELSTFANLFSDDATGYDDTQCMTETEIRNQKEKKLDDGKKRTYFDNGNKKSELSYTNDKLDGTQIYWHSNGKKSAESNYKLGIKDGKQSWWFMSGQISSVEYYKNNLKNGGHFTYWENGNKKFAGRYKDGKKHGKFTWWTIDEKIRAEQDYLNNELVPEESEINNSEDINSSSKDEEVTLSCKEITDRNKRLDCYDSLSVIDEQIETLEDSSVTSLELTNDEAVELTVLETNENDTNLKEDNSNIIPKNPYDPNLIKVSSWSNLNPTDKQFEEVYENGQIKFTSSSEGNIEVITKLYENGQKMQEISYIFQSPCQSDRYADENNECKLRTGVWTQWYENGFKFYEDDMDQSYFDGASKTKWNKNGQIFEHYVDGKKEGKWTSFHANGNKKSEKFYSSDKKDSKWTEWYENEQKRFEMNFKNDKRDGMLIKWNENGQKKSVTNYKDGKIDGEQTLWNEDGECISGDCPE